MTARNRSDNMFLVPAIYRPAIASLYSIVNVRVVANHTARSCQAF